MSSETPSEPCQTSKMEPFCENSLRRLAVNSYIWQCSRYFSVSYDYFWNLIANINQKFFFLQLHGKNIQAKSIVNVLTGKFYLFCQSVDISKVNRKQYKQHYLIAFSLENQRRIMQAKVHYLRCFLLQIEMTHNPAKVAAAKGIFLLSMGYRCTLLRWMPFISCGN